MPHLIVEYTANLEEELDIGALLGALHEALEKTGETVSGGAG